MSDLISREETIARFVGAMRSREKSEHPMPLTEERIVRFLKAMPPAAEPKVGKWEECKVVDIEDTTITEIQSAYCPICHKYHTTPYMYYFDYFNYCPNCGAKMERSE